MAMLFAMTGFCVDKAVEAERDLDLAGSPWQRFQVYAFWAIIWALLLMTLVLFLIALRLCR